MPLPALHTEETVNCCLLTNGERKVVELLARGATRHQIAERLELSVKTVDAHIQNAQAKIGVKGRVFLTRWAIRNDLVSLEETEDYWPQK